MRRWIVLVVIALLGGALVWWSLAERAGERMRQPRDGAVREIGEGQGGGGLVLPGRRGGDDGYVVLLVDAANGEGVVGGTVCIVEEVHGGVYECRGVDAAGEVRFEAIAARVNYRVWGAAPGYVPASVPASGEPAFRTREAQGRNVRIGVARGGDRIAGRVVDASGGTIEGAVVEMRDGVRRAGICVSGEDGRFDCAAQAGRRSVALGVVAPGYSDNLLSVFAPAENVVITLFAESVLQGWVVDERGARLGGVDVVVLPSILQSRPNALETTTRADGTFRIGGLRAGEYRLEVASGPWRSEPRKLSVHYAEQLDGLVLTARRGHVLRVWIAAQGGDACAEPSAAMSRAEAPGLQRGGRRGADGWLEFAGVEDGAYVVRAQCLGHVDAEATVEVRADGERRFTLARGGEIRGVVRGEDGRGVAHAYVGARGRGVETDAAGRFVLAGLPWGEAVVAAHDPRGWTGAPVTVALREGAAAPEVALVLRPEDCVRGRVVRRGGGRGPLVVRTRDHEARVDAADRFELCGVAVGTTVEIRVSGSDEERAVFRAGSDAAELMLAWRIAARDEEVVVEVDERPRVVTGTVRDADGERVADALVITSLVAAGSRTCERPTSLHRTRAAVSHADGEFVVENVTAGRHVLFASLADGRIGCAWISVPAETAAVIEMPAAQE